MIKYILFFFNLLFVITGIIITFFGFTVKAYYHEYGTFLNTKFIYLSDLLIVIGVVIFLVAFFGCCGAFKENACMTYTFSSLLIAIFILELIVGCGGFLLKGSTEEYLKETLGSTMERYGKENQTEITVLWDNIQRQFNCCGVNTPNDWLKILNSTNSLPLSCCNVPPGATGNMSCTINSNPAILHSEGCLTEFGEYIRGHATTVEAVGLTLAIAQLLGIICACYLSKQIRRDYETV